MEIKMLTSSDEMWKKVRDYAESCSWGAGRSLADAMENDQFTEWERVIIALDDMKICGYCTVAKTDCIPDVNYTPYIGYMFVGEEYRGNRLSQKLIQYAMDYLMSIGFDRVHIVSDHENLYEKYGFEVIDRKTAPWGSVEKIYMQHFRHFFLTGDCHGDLKKIDVFCRNHVTGKDDVMIILGDAGINYWLDEKDRKVKRYLSRLLISFLVVHGNHEARASEIESYKERKWMGGTVYYEEEFPDILFAKDGEIYNFNGKKGIVIGGAYSVDKDYRLSVGLPWFESEQPSAEIKSYVEEQLGNHGWTVDYVLSHTCPQFMEPTDLFLDAIGQGKVDMTTEEWLEQIHKKLKYQKWYFGHFHENRCYASMEMLFEEIKELGSDDFLQRLGRPKYRQGERVMFSNGADDMYGEIVVVDAYGTYGQSREVSYDIERLDGEKYDRVVHKHIPESRVERI